MNIMAFSYSLLEYQKECAANGININSLTSPVVDINFRIGIASGMLITGIIICNFITTGVLGTTSPLVTAVGPALTNATTLSNIANTNTVCMLKLTASKVGICSQVLC